MDIVFRYLHFLGILILSGSLVLEAAWLKPVLTRAQLRKLAKVDAAVGIGAALVLIAGFLLWFQGAKPAAFYGNNPVFIAKISLFGIIALASVYPTVFFLRQGKGPMDEEVAVPAALRLIVKLELALILLLPLLAVLMAKGIGLPR